MLPFGLWKYSGGALLWDLVLRIFKSRKLLIKMLDQSSHSRLPSSKLQSPWTLHFASTCLNCNYFASELQKNIGILVYCLRGCQYYFAAYQKIPSSDGMSSPALTEQVLADVAPQLLDHEDPALFAPTGFKARECCTCWRPRSVCLCPFLPEQPLQTLGKVALGTASRYQEIVSQQKGLQVVILQHPNEQKKRLATVPLLRKCVPYDLYKGRRFTVSS